MEMRYENSNPFSGEHEQDLGTIYMDNGERVFPKAPAFLSGTDKEPCYMAYAVSEGKDADGEPITDYLVYWDDNADWDEFEVVQT
jgi:hypothetical protein